MSDVEITLSLPSELVEKARSQGLLNSARIARMLEAEIERMAQWQESDPSLEDLLDGITADNRHDEIDFGGPAGKEDW